MQSQPPSVPGRGGEARTARSEHKKGRWAACLHVSRVNAI